MLKVGQTGLVKNLLDIASSHTNAERNYKLESPDNDVLLAMLS